MRDEDRKKIYEAAMKHGWTWNPQLIIDLDVALMKEGYELVVRKVGKR